MKLFGNYIFIERHTIWSCCRLVHYAGAMTTYWLGPFALVIDGREKRRLRERAKEPK